MTLSTDDIMDRRTLRKKVSFWRISAFVLVAGLIIAVFAASGAFSKLSAYSDEHIARVKIEGTITNDVPMLNLLGKLKNENSVKAVILNVSSPGGTTVGGEAIFVAVRELSEKKPVVTSVGTLAASAGYMIASASDHIVARRSSIIGSIGVLFQFGNVTGLMDKIGVEVDTVKSSPLKAEPSPFNETTAEEKAVLADLVEDSYQWFVGLVADRRKMEREEVLKLANGAVFSGAQSVENGLIDSIGGENTAKEWLVNEKTLNKDLKIIEWKPKRPNDGLFAGASALTRIAKSIGLDIEPVFARELGNLVPKRLFLDGLLSIWVSSGREAAEGKMQ